METPLSQTSQSMASSITDIGTLVSRTPGLHGGVPHFSGKGITVRRIVNGLLERD
jgi:uncharacterized protein (DUF433 family)